MMRQWACYKTILPVVLLLLVCTDTIIGQYRRYSTRARRPSRSTQAPGPNMCKVQHVLGSKKKFFTECVSNHVKVICDRPTYERWECCAGFAKQRKKPGCPVEKPLSNITDTLTELGLKKFHNFLVASGLDKELNHRGVFTLFAPSDQALKEASADTLSLLGPEDDDTLPLTNYHVAPGKLNVSTFRVKDQEFVTLHNSDRVRVNKYAYGVATVNCARIVRPDQIATNGVIHVIDKVIQPSEIRGSLAQKIKSQEKTYSKFHLTLLAANMVKKLQAKNKGFTVLAPTDDAFAKLPAHVVDMIVSDADTAKKVVDRHVVRGVFCADAIVLSMGLKTWDDSRLLFRCKRDGLEINGAKVTHPDVVASNGVLHGVDKVLLPDSVKDVGSLMKDMHLESFWELVREAGLNGTFDINNITLFSPTNKAWAELPRDYMSTLRKDPMKLKKILQYHIVMGRIGDGELVGDSLLRSVADTSVKLKVNVYRKGVAVDKAPVHDHPRECKNAVVHTVDKVLIPPENSLLDELLADPEYSEFASMMKNSTMDTALVPDATYTVLAPSNKALRYLNQRQLQNIKNSYVRLFRFVSRHVIFRTVLKCSIPTSGVYSLVSLQGDHTKFHFDTRGRLYANRHARVLSDDILTSNGVLYKINHVLPCSCERKLRTSRGRYISDHNYRKRYY